MAQVGSAEIKAHKVERFLSAPAPMTAKCIIRDELRDQLNLNEHQASEIVATIIIRLAAYEYHIEQAQD